MTHAASKLFFAFTSRFYACFLKAFCVRTGCLFAASLSMIALVNLPVSPAFAQGQTQDSQKEPDEKDLKFVFVTSLAIDEDGELQPKDKDIPDLSDGDLLSGDNILKRLDANEEAASRSLLQDHNLAAYIVHPVSGKSFELQIGNCAALDYVTGDLPYPQQVQCDDDLYSYRAGPHGVEILVNGEIFFDIPLDAGLYRLNGVDVTFTKPASDSSDTGKPK
nr:hypothetical protein [uncultured Cohaesibacter sp.]